jgi:hypothetical protein
MHQKKQYEATVNKHVHKPPDEAFLEDPVLQNNIKEQHLQQDYNFSAEKGPQYSFYRSL